MGRAPSPATRSTRTRRWPWLVAGATLVVFVLANALYPSADADLLWTGMFSLIIFAFVFVGALLASRVPDNPIGPVILGSGALLASRSRSARSASSPPSAVTSPCELLALAAIANDLGFQVPIIVILIGVPLIFPTGRLLSPRWRWIVALAVAAIAAVTVAALLGPGPARRRRDRQPVRGAGPRAAGRAARTRRLRGHRSSASRPRCSRSSSGIAAATRSSATSQVADRRRHWSRRAAFPAGIHRAGRRRRHGRRSLSACLAMLALPLAIGVAVLRYRLYEIDRIISRTIGWAIISGILLVAFVGLVVGLQAVLARFTSGGTLAVAASTLIAAALFQPVRRRVQQVVDRRFDRTAYDARRTADAFAERLRHEVDLDTLRAETERTVAQAIRPTTASLWLPGRKRT